MASKTSEESKYDAYDDVSDAEEEQQNEIVVVAPPPRRKGGRSGGRSILPPSGKKPNNSSARSRARMQHVKPPPKGKRGPGVSARAQYRRMAMEKAQANNKDDDVREGKVRDISDSEDEHSEENNDGFSSKVADKGDRFNSNSGYYNNNSNNNNNKGNDILDLSDDAEDSDEDMYEHFSMQNNKDDHRKPRQEKAKKPIQSGFFDDDSDDDQFDLPDITEGSHDLDIEAFQDEFGVSGWAEKKTKSHYSRNRINKKKTEGYPKRSVKAGQRVSRNNEREIGRKKRNNKTDDHLKEDREVGDQYATAGSKSCDIEVEEDNARLPFLRVGDTVDAKAKGWIRYYSGAVKKVRNDGSIDVHFDDGELHQRLPRIHVKLIKRRERVGFSNARDHDEQKVKRIQTNMNAQKVDKVGDDYDSEMCIDENISIQNSGTSRSNSEMTERSSPKRAGRNEDTKKKTRNEMLHVEEEGDEYNKPHDCGTGLDSGSQSPKGSSTEPKGVKRQEMTPYNEALVPTRRADLAKFLILPPYKGVNKTIRCYIKRHNKGLNALNPIYTFHLEKAGAKGKHASRQLMVAQKILQSSSCNFLISLDRDDMGKSYNNRSKFYLGKLQAKKGTDEFVLYDRGMNPSDLVDLVKSTTFEMKESAARREMASIVYDRSKDVIKSRRMEVTLPAVVRDDGKTVTEAQFRPFTDEDSMYKKFKEIRENGTQNVEANERLLCLHNRMFSAGRTALLSEYSGRANETSVKNFQLCVSQPRKRDHMEKFHESKLGQAEKDEPERVMLQLGRDADEFNVDFTYPMSFFAAFGICLSRFVTKQKEDF